MSVLCKKSTVKELLGRNRADTADDPFIQFLLNHHSEIVRGACRRTFEYGAETEYLTLRVDNYGETNLQRWILKRFPVDEDQAFTVHMNTSQDWTANALLTELVEGTDYEIDATTGELRLVRSMWAKHPFDRTNVYDNVTAPSMPRAIRVQYTGGYTVSDADPGDSTSDPTEDYDTVAVPDGLQMVIAQKVANDLQQRRASAWKTSEYLMLRDWVRR